MILLTSSRASAYLVPDRQLDPYFAEFLPVKEGRVPRAHQHAGCEFLYLLSGTLDVRHGEATHRVEAGDAIYFDANTIHSYVCTSKTPATAVIVTLQHPLMHADGRRVQSRCTWAMGSFVASRRR